MIAPVVGSNPSGLRNVRAAAAWSSYRSTCSIEFPGGTGVGVVTEAFAVVVESKKSALRTAQKVVAMLQRHKKHFPQKNVLQRQQTHALQDNINSTRKRVQRHRCFVTHADTSSQLILGKGGSCCQHVACMGAELHNTERFCSPLEGRRSPPRGYRVLQHLRRRRWVWTWPRHRSTSVPSPLRRPARPPAKRGLIPSGA